MNSYLFMSFNIHLYFFLFGGVCNLFNRLNFDSFYILERQYFALFVQYRKNTKYSTRDKGSEIVTFKCFCHLVSILKDIFCDIILPYF